MSWKMALVKSGCLSGYDVILPVRWRICNQWRKTSWPVLRNIVTDVIRSPWSAVTSTKLYCSSLHETVDALKLIQCCSRTYSQCLHMYCVLDNVFFFLFWFLMIAAHSIAIWTQVGIHARTPRPNELHENLFLACSASQSVRDSSRINIVFKWTNFVETGAGKLTILCCSVYWRQEFKSFRGSTWDRCQVRSMWGPYQGWYTLLLRRAKNCCIPVACSWADA